MKIQRFITRPDLNISVVIPALNERAALPDVVERVRRCLPSAEVVVADGGSGDGMREWVLGRPDLRLVDAERGRGPQMNAGARSAGGEVLLFLHADCLLPDGAEEAIRAALADPAAVGGAFCIRFAADCPASLHRLAGLINLRSRLASEATGDQAVFVRRAVFEAVQGFPDWPLFEDFALVSRVKRQGRFRILPAAVTISPRRWLTHGVWRTSLLMCLLYLGYRLGVAPTTLKRWFADVRPPPVPP
jgi:rSAM/selenodomain-associated transferase 2